MADKIEVENVNVPGQVTRLDRKKYEAMREALMAVLPQSEAEAMKVADALAELRPRLPQEHFPGGKTSGWWQKAVQLDLEAKGVIRRAERPPVRLWRCD